LQVSAIAAVWYEVERAARAVARASGLRLLDHVTTYRTIQELVDREIVPRNIAMFYQDLRDLRNRAVHADDFSLRVGEAERYPSLALRLVAQLQEIEQNITERDNNMQ
jgi:hypothetical protein